jgi:hypothetical protein
LVPFILLLEELVNRGHRSSCFPLPSMSIRS